MSWRGDLSRRVAEKCLRRVLEKIVVEDCLGKSVGGECCGGSVVGSVVTECCREVLCEGSVVGSVVTKCCREVLCEGVL